MILKRLNLKTIIKRQAGFTLVELLVAIAITGVIGLGASVSIGQLINQTSQNRDYALATRYVTNAIYWISHDTIMAQKMEGYSGFPLTDDLTLKWTTWDAATYSVNYTLENGTLKRTCSDGVNVSTIVIADYINPAADKTYCSSNNGTLILSITSSVGKGDHIVNVTQKKEIDSRPRL
jgi:prepilin-type N-terminal cleavage/methylation domain-containing protein